MEEIYFKEEKGQNGKIHLLTIFLVLIIVLVVGAGVYYWQEKNFEGRLNQISVNLKNEIIQEMKKEDQEITQSNQPEDEDKEIKEEEVETFFQEEELGIEFDYPSDLGVYNKVLASNLLSNQIDRGLTYKFQKPYLLVIFEKKGFKLEAEDKEETKKVPFDKIPYVFGLKKSLESYCQDSNFGVYKLNCEVINLGKNSKGVLKDEVACYLDSINGTMACDFVKNLIFETENVNYPVGVLSLNLGRYDYKKYCDSLDLGDACFKNAELDFSERMSQKVLESDQFDEIVKSFLFK